MNTKDNQEAEREAFQEWAKKHDIRNIRLPAGHHFSSDANYIAWAAWQARATLTTTKVNEEVASGEAVCSICNNSGYYCIGYSGLECDGNAPMLERCDCEIGQPTPSPSNVLVEALEFIKNGNCATLQGAIIHASQTLAAYSASTDSVSISRSEYEEPDHGLN